MSQEHPDTWSETTPSADWWAAAELCARDLAFWGDEDSPSLAIMCNDVFHPAADGEDIPPSLVHEVLAIARSEEGGWRSGNPLVMRWIANRRGYPPDMVWWSKRKRNPEQLLATA